MDTKPTREELIARIQKLKEAYDKYNKEIESAKQEIQNLEKDISDKSN